MIYDPIAILEQAAQLRAMKAWYYHQALRAQRTAPEHRPQLYSAMNVDVLECFVVIYLIYICLIKFTVGSLSS